jgi:hypothetical protein
MDVERLPAYVEDQGFIGKRCKSSANQQPPSYSLLVLVYCSQDEITRKAFSYAGRCGKINAMKVSFTQPEKQLSPYVAFIWVFENSFGVPLADSRIIAPDRPRIREYTVCHLPGKEQGLHRPRMEG